MAFTKTGTFNINDGRNANKNYLLSSDSQSDGLCTKLRQPALKSSTCRTAHTWKNMIRGSWLDISLFSHVGKGIRDIWLVYISLRTKIYSAAFQCVNLSMYILIKYWIKNISRNIEAVFLKLGARNVHHKRNKMTPVMLLPWQQFCRWSCLN